MDKEFNTLIVDDCKVMRSVIKKTLEISGLNTGRMDTAADGCEGMNCVLDNEYSLIILDLNMPNMDGTEMLNLIRKEYGYKDVPVLIVSAESNTDRIKEMLKLGCGFIHKPFTPEILKKELIKIAEVELE